jgi:hypothetical protein
MGHGADPARRASRTEWVEVTLTPVTTLTYGSETFQTRTSMPASNAAAPVLVLREVSLTARLTNREPLLACEQARRDGPKQLADTAWLLGWWSVRRVP